MEWLWLVVAVLLLDQVIKGFFPRFYEKVQVPITYIMASICIGMICYYAYSVVMLWMGGGETGEKILLTALFLLGILVFVWCTRRLIRTAKRTKEEQQILEKRAARKKGAAEKAKEAQKNASQKPAVKRLDGKKSSGKKHK